MAFLRPAGKGSYFFCSEASNELACLEISGPWVKWSARRGASNKVYWDENHLDVAVEPSPVRRDSLCVVGIGMRVDEQDPTQHLRIDDRSQRRALVLFVGFQIGILG